MNQNSYKLTFSKFNIELHVKFSSNIQSIFSHQINHRDVKIDESESDTLPTIEYQNSLYTVTDKLCYKEDLIAIDRTWFIKEPGEYVLEFAYSHPLEPIHWIVPAVLYDGNLQGSGAFPKSNLAREFCFREDRCSIPSAFILWSDEQVVASWTTPATCERELSSALIAKPNYSIRIPYSETPFPYRRKWLPPRKPVKQHWRMEAGETYHRRFFLYVKRIVNESNPLYSLLEIYRQNLDDNLWKSSQKANNTIHINSCKIGKIQSNVDIIPTKSEICKDINWGRQIALRARLLHDALVLRCRDTCGVPTLSSRHLFTMHSVLSGGFVGRNLDIAASFIFLSNMPGYEHYWNSGQRIADFFLKGSTNGLYRGEYHLPTRTWYGYFPTRKRQVNVRLLGEMGIGWLDCFKFADEKKNHSWLDAAIEVAEFFLNHQLENGSFGQWWSLNGECLQDQGTSGAHIAYLMVLLDSFKGENRFEKSVYHYVQYARKAFIEPWRYFGDTLDADCIDKEAAIVLLRFWLAYWELTQEPQILQECRQIATWALSWMYFYKVPFNSSSFLGKRNFSTFGGTSVSVAHHHLDIYGIALALELFRLRKATGESLWSEMARLLLSFVAQCVADEGDFLGRAEYLAGFQPEQFNQTDWDYIHTWIWPKGSIKNMIAWVPALTLRTLLEIREAFPEEIPGEIPALDSLKLPRYIRLWQKLSSYLNPF